MVKDSCVLIGVVDDKGILAPNQIYCQIRKDTVALIKRKKSRSRSSPSKNPNGEDNGGVASDESFDLNDEGARILQGKIMVSRNPCTHPGDIRLLEAVDIPEYRHLINVVVFPSTGLRPLCNMMSGGVLDRDVYFLCWE